LNFILYPGSTQRITEQVVAIAEHLLVKESPASGTCRNVTISRNPRTRQNSNFTVINGLLEFATGLKSRPFKFLVSIDQVLFDKSLVGSLVVADFSF